MPKKKDTAMPLIATTPPPPYYAVIFTSLKSSGDDGYGEMADRMVELVGQQEGFLGFESAREEVGITVSYWRDMDSIQRWKANLEHQDAQQLGKTKWYQAYTIRIARVEREYSLDASHT
jgi:heme-degrading monooxygenase HmoA